MLMDVFGFLFETEGTDNLKSELTQIDKKTEEVKKDSDKLSDSFATLTRALAPLAAGYAVLKTSMDFSREAEQIGYLTNMTGMSAQSLGELGVAAAEFGGNINSAASAVMGLQRNILQLRRTGGGALVQAGMMYGISISTDPEQMLKNIAKRFETLSKPMQVDLGHMLGLDNATIMMLQGGLKQFTEQLERAKKYTFIDDSMVERARTLMRINRENSLVWEGIKNILLDYINPFVVGIVEIFRDMGEFLLQHKTFVASIAAGIAAIAVAMLPIKSIAAAVFGFLTGWGGVLVAIVAAIALIGDDIEKYLDGENSLLGELLNKFPELEGIIADLIVDVNDLWDAFKNGDIWEAVKEQISEWSSELSAFWERFKKTEEFESLKNVFKTLQPEIKVIKEVYSSIYDKVSDIISKTIEWSSKSDLIMNVCRTIASIIEVIIKGITKLIALIGEGLNAAIDSALGGFESITNYFSEGGQYEEHKEKVKKYISEFSFDNFNPVNWFRDDKSKTLENTVSAISTTSYSSIANDSHANSNTVNANITNNFYPQSTESGDMYAEKIFADDLNEGVLGHMTTGGK